MSFSHLRVHFLRNIISAELNLHERCNLIVGRNGSGKTSLLEALYILSTGHSFRTRETLPLIQEGKDELILFARTFKEQTVSIQKSLSSPTQIKLNKEPCQASSELAKTFPCQIFYQDLFQIMDAGPNVRRRLLDWGLFYSNAEYLAVWKDYHLILKQRNAALRSKASLKNIAPWNTQLLRLAMRLDVMRAAYFEQWHAIFHTVLAKLTSVECDIQYYKGWDKSNMGKTLDVILEEQWVLDSKRFYTQSGAHQADIIFKTPSLKAKQVLSRGQQKIILLALKLAQAQLLEGPCLYLLDDLSTELDIEHLERFLQYLTEVKGQFFFTSLELSSLPALPFEKAVFKVERSVVSQ